MHTQQQRLLVFKSQQGLISVMLWRLLMQTVQMSGLNGTVYGTVHYKHDKEVIRKSNDTVPA